MNKIIAIAIDEYEDNAINNLNNCSNDINALIDAISNKYVFGSIELYLRHEQTTVSFLYKELYNELINSLPDDSILILFAGHGEYNSVLNSSYWLCSDSKKDDVTTWFNVSDLLNFFRASPAKHIAIISNSCFAGAIFDMDRGGGHKALSAKAARQALTSGGIEKVKDGPKDQGSLFNEALIHVLNENSEKELSFDRFSENVILRFSDKNIQTPRHGHLVHSGDDGGSYFFYVKENTSISSIQTLQIALDINEKIKIKSSFAIPFFNKNEYFEVDFVNAFIQQIGFSIVNDVRVTTLDDEEYSISRSEQFPYYLEVSYTIETFNTRYLSIIINRSEYFGGPHPNHYIYGINFAFKPERKISLWDIVDYSAYGNPENFLAQMIEQYADEEAKPILNEYASYEYIHGIDFSFNDNLLTIYLFNLLPHAYKGAGILNIPRDYLKFKF